MRMPGRTIDLLSRFRLTPEQKIEAWQAWLQDPDGLERCALEARDFGRRHGNGGAGLFLTMIRRGEHQQELRDERVTGWRWVRGTHSGSYVRDPHGTDPLPQGHQK